jgi:hypothetical protein
MATNAKLEESEPLGMAVTADGNGNDRHLTKKYGESCIEYGSFSSGSLNYMPTGEFATG